MDGRKSGLTLHKLDTASQKEDGKGYGLDGVGKEHQSILKLHIEGGSGTDEVWTGTADRYGRIVHVKILANLVGHCPPTHNIISRIDEENHGG